MRFTGSLRDHGLSLARAVLLISPSSLFVCSHQFAASTVACRSVRHVSRSQGYCSMPPRPFPTRPVPSRLVSSLYKTRRPINGLTAYASVRPVVARSLSSLWGRRSTFSIYNAVKRGYTSLADVGILGSHRGFGGRRLAHSLHESSQFPPASLKRYELQFVLRSAGGASSGPIIRCRSLAVSPSPSPLLLELRAASILIPCPLCLTPCPAVSDSRREVHAWTCVARRVRTGWVRVTHDHCCTQAGRWIRRSIRTP